MNVPPIGDWLDTAPWRDRAVSLLVIPPCGVGGAEQDHTLTGKRAMLDGDIDDAHVLVLWTGKYRTEVRRIPRSALQLVRERL